MRYRRKRHLGSLVIMIVAILAGAGPALGQFGSSNRFTLSEAQVATVDSTVEGEFAAIEALLEDQHWDEAVERLRALAERADHRLVLVDAKSGLYVNLREHCHSLICRLPLPALSLYRDRVDSVAEQWYRQGVAERDVRLLERVVSDMFASSFGDDALYALGELALQRGAYSEARRSWERITPLARDPKGRPLWIALAGIDLQKSWSEVEPLLTSREDRTKRLVYPDTDLEVAHVLGRLTLVSIREGALHRAEIELDVLRGLYPRARGHLGGKEVILEDALAELLMQASAWPSPKRNDDWNTFAGSGHRNGHAPNAPLAANQVVWRAAYGDDSRTIDGRNPPRQRQLGGRVGDDADEPLSVHPIIVGGRLLYNDLTRIYSVTLAYGDSAIEGRPDGVLYAPDQEPTRAIHRLGVGRLGVARFTLTAADGNVFGRTGNPLTGRAENTRLAGDEAVIGLEIEGGRLVFQVDPEGDRWAFEGAPLIAGDQVLVALRQSDVRPRAEVASFSRTDGQLLWKTFIAAADTPARPGWEEISHHLLTLAGNTVYYSTDLGVIASLNVRDGHVHWIKRYDRADEGDLSQLAPHFDRDLAPCVYHQGVLYCAPADTPFLFALDAVTGDTLWATDFAENVVHLLGVVGNRLIASGDQLWWFDAGNGQVVARWPEGPGAGIHGYGRGIIAGDSVLWPTREQRIFVFDVMTARQKREAFDLRPLDVQGGSLLVAGDLLVVAGAQEIVALGPPTQLPDSEARADVALLEGAGAVE